MSKYDIVGNLMHWLKCIELHIYLKTNILSASLISFEMNINRLVTTSLMPSTDKLLKTADCRRDMCFLLTVIFQDKWYIIKLADNDDACRTTQEAIFQINTFVVHGAVST